MAKKKDLVKKATSTQPFAKYLVVNTQFTLRPDEGEDTNHPENVAGIIEDIEDDEFSNDNDDALIGVYKLVKFIKVKRTVTRDVSKY